MVLYQMWNLSLHNGLELICDGPQLARQFIKFELILTNGSSNRHAFVRCSESPCEKSNFSRVNGTAHHFLHSQTSFSGTDP